MHERMEFPWEVEEVKPGLAYIGMPDGTELVDPECEAVRVLPDLIEALQEALQFLLFGDDDGPISGSCHVQEKIAAALSKAGHWVTT